jgi:hypothetical protein
VVYTKGAFAQEHYSFGPQWQPYIAILVGASSQADGGNANAGFEIFLPYNFSLIPLFSYHYKNSAVYGATMCALNPMLNVRYYFKEFSAKYDSALFLQGGAGYSYLSFPGSQSGRSYHAVTIDGRIGYRLYVSRPVSFDFYTNYDHFWKIAPSESLPIKQQNRFGLGIDVDLFIDFAASR